MAARQIARLSALRPVAGSFAARRTFSSIDTAYTAVAQASGSRANGKGSVEGSSLLKDVKFAMPKALGGTEDPTKANPEQLFAMGYSVCFLQAIHACYKQLFPKGEPLPEEIALAVKASIGKPTNGQPGFQIGVNIELFHSSFSSVLPDTTDAERLLTAAHQFCPYSRAVQGNVESTIALR